MTEDSNASIGNKNIQGLGTSKTSIYINQNNDIYDIY